MATKTIWKSAGILIRDRKLLVERSKGKRFFISPGGSLEEGETDTEALARELREEFLLETRVQDFEFFGEFTAEAANHPGAIVIMRVFVVKRWTGEPTPNEEVEEMAWITSSPPPTMAIGSIFKDHVIPLLHAEGLID